MHTQEHHYAAMGFPRVKCSRKTCHSNANDGQEELRGGCLKILLIPAMCRSLHSSPLPRMFSKAGTSTTVFLCTHKGDIQYLWVRFVIHSRNICWATTGVDGNVLDTGTWRRARHTLSLNITALQSHEGNRPKVNCEMKTIFTNCGNYCEGLDRRAKWWRTGGCGFKSHEVRGQKSLSNRDI